MKEVPAEFTSAAPASSIRSLQIEADGDRWKGVKPKIRVTGRWLERAGFKPGARVRVILRGAGRD